MSEDLERLLRAAADLEVSPHAETRLYAGIRRQQRRRRATLLAGIPGAVIAVVLGAVLVAQRPQHHFAPTLSVEPSSAPTTYLSVEDTKLVLRRSADASVIARPQITGSVKAITSDRRGGYFVAHGTGTCQTGIAHISSSGVSVAMTGNASALRYQINSLATNYSGTQLAIALSVGGDGCGHLRPTAELGLMIARITGTQLTSEHSWNASGSGGIGATNLSWSPDGQHLVYLAVPCCGGGTNGTVELDVMSPATGTFPDFTKDPLGRSGNPRVIAPDGPPGKLHEASTGRDLICYGQGGAVLPSGHLAIAMGCSPQNNAAGSDAGNLLEIDPDNGTIVRTISAEIPTRSSTISDTSGQHLLVTGSTEDGEQFLVRIDNGTKTNLPPAAMATW